MHVQVGTRNTLATGLHVKHRFVTLLRTQSRFTGGLGFLEVLTPSYVQLFSNEAQKCETIMQTEPMSFPNTRGIATPAHSAWAHFIPLARP